MATKLYEHISMEYQGSIVILTADSDAAHDWFISNLDDYPPQEDDEGRLAVAVRREHFIDLLNNMCVDLHCRRY